jgi:iron(III) transport system substrate-binding protein
MAPSRCAVGIALLVVVAAGCQRPAKEVVVYCALDREFSEPILQQFENETGIHVRAKYDTESTKSVGLTELILRERHQPRCDLFWNNEALHTARLARDGVLEPYDSPVGQQYPAAVRSKDGLWYGFAARARVLLINTDAVAATQVPRRLEDLTLPRWRGRVGIAKPLFGTTATHVASLFAAWGPEKTKDWLHRLKANDVQVLSGNKQVAVQVGAGTIAMGLTDTDDALGEIRQHRPVEIVFLEQEADDLGLLVIPNTLSIVRGAPHREAAQRLLDFLLTPAVEETLSASPSGQLPLHPAARAAGQVALPPTAKRMDVDYDRVAGLWAESTAFVKEAFTAP